ncbi:MAG: formate/nitrite transporter family protein [Eubacterium sp.]|nr:formate/nitrite transporter family protein [Eubacterium sp.]
MKTPAEIAKSYVTAGTAKANQSLVNTFLLSILAGMFIGLGAVAANTVGATVESGSLAKLLGAMVFPGGLAMVILAGSELFTGNCLLIIPLLEKQINALQVLRNWVIVWIGNFVGGIITAAITVYSHQPSLFSDAVALTHISTAAAKCSLSFSDAFLKGIGCNFLVCIAVWMTFAATDAAGKVVALYLPILMFVLIGFEHSVANMTYITLGIFASGEYADVASSLDLSALNWANFFTANLIPVTLGNIVGGSIFVGLVYWRTYLYKSGE